MYHRIDEMYVLAASKDIKYCFMYRRVTVTNASCTPNRLFCIHIFVMRRYALNIGYTYIIYYVDAVQYYYRYDDQTLPSCDGTH